MRRREEHPTRTVRPSVGLSLPIVEFLPRVHTTAPAGDPAATAELATCIGRHAADQPSPQPPICARREELRAVGRERQSVDWSVVGTRHGPHTSPPLCRAAASTAGTVQPAAAATTTTTTTTAAAAAAAAATVEDADRRGMVLVHVERAAAGRRTRAPDVPQAHGVVRRARRHEKLIGW